MNTLHIFENEKTRLKNPCLLIKPIKITRKKTRYMKFFLYFVRSEVN